MNIVQIFLMIVVTILTILICVTGWYGIQVLKEIKKSIQKVNLILDDTEVVSKGISQSVTGVSGIVDGIKSGLSIVSLFTKFKKNE